jgi:cytochrome oxidase Cu insertion factor (SCO1/SenC/PrrC family)
MSSCAYSWENDETLPSIASPRKSIENRERRVFMNRLITAIVFAGLLVPTIRAAEKPAETPPLPAVKVGDMAPDFTLTDQNGNKVSLKDFKGKKNVALAFYIFAFTGG